MPKSKSVSQSVRNKVISPVKKSKLEWLWDGHKKPTTRREFMAKGLLGSAAYIFAPSALQVLCAAQAHADDASCTVPASGLPGYITINLSGGSGMVTSYFGLDANRQPLTSYTKSGLGSFASNQLVTDFQGVPFPSTSPFYNGIVSMSSASTRKNTAFIATMVPSRDDRNDNLLDASGLVAAAGLSGSLLPKLGTLPGSISGIGQASAILAPPAPLTVTNITDLTGALGISSTSNLKTLLTADQRTSMFKLINSLSTSQGRALASVNSSTGTTLAQLIMCATGKNADLAVPGSDPGIDPTVTTNADNTAMNALWSFSNTTTLFGRTQKERQIFGSVAYNAINGKAGAAGIELSGYDYHDGTRTTGTTKDTQAGQLIGVILETAAKLQRQVVIHVVADGSTGTAAGGLDAGFVADRGDGGMTYMFCYSPVLTAASMMKTDSVKWQLGDYTSGQGSDSTNALVGSPEKASIATFANYLQFAGKYSTLMDQVLPRQYTSDQADYVLRFA